MNKKLALEELEYIKKKIEEDDFDGMFAYISHRDHRGSGHWNKGDADDYIGMVDLVFQALYDEPNKPSQKYFLTEMYKRWKYYFGRIRDATANDEGRVI